MAMMNLPAVQNTETVVIDSNLGNVVRTMTCAVCGKLIVRNSGVQKYCPECRADKNRQNARFYKLQKKHGEDRARELIAKAPGYLRRSNFEDSEHEQQRMLILRQQGQTNAQIAKAIGRGYAFVLQRLGKQPEFMTAQSKKTAGECRRKRNVGAKTNAKVYRGVQKHDEICDQIREMHLEMKKMEARMIRLRRKANKYQEDVAKLTDAPSDATKVCKICDQVFIPVKKNSIHCPACAKVVRTGRTFVSNAVHVPEHRANARARKAEAKAV